MSITVRYWSKEELAATQTDKWLATLLLNATTLDENMVKASNAIPSKWVKRYQCEWRYYDEEPVTIHATDEKMLARFIDEEYTSRPQSIYQVITQYRPVNL